MNAQARLQKLAGSLERGSVLERHILRHADLGRCIQRLLGGSLFTFRLVCSSVLDSKGQGWRSAAVTQ